jgi:hypothetical protein
VGSFWIGALMTLLTPLHISWSFRPPLVRRF